MPLCSLFRPSLIAAACAGLFASGAALAQSASASVDTTGFSYQLIDLDLNDGVTPAITFTERISSTSHYDNSTGAIEYQQIDTFGSTAMTRPFGAASTSATASTSHAEAGFSLSSPYFQLFSGQHFYGWDFEITPSTGILFQTATTLNAAHEGDGTRSFAGASMFGYLRHYGGEALEESTFTDVVAIESGTRRYTLSGYLHSGGESLQGAVGFGTEATAAFYGIAPVPEPSTYGMLLAGLGLLGWRLRRTRC